MQDQNSAQAQHESRQIIAGQTSSELRSHPAAMDQPVAARARDHYRGRLPLEEMAANPTRLRQMIMVLAWPVAAEMLLQTLTQIIDMTW